MRTDSRNRRGLLAIAVGAALLTSSWPAWGDGTAAQRCERAVLSAAAKYWSCMFRARATATMTGAAPDPRQCEDPYGKRLLTVHARYGTACPKNIWTGGSQRFVDRGDDTVFDVATGLQWEKKRNLDGKRDPADPHDGDNVYSWTQKTKGGTAADGTAFTSFIAALNREPCFANHCDWRLPSFAELRTILVSREPCAVKPCIDPIFGPTAPSFYWSGEESSYHPVRAWYVFFLTGKASTSPKPSANPARAVRSDR